MPCKVSDSRGPAGNNLFRHVNFVIRHICFLVSAAGGHFCTAKSNKMYKAVSIILFLAFAVLVTLAVRANKTQTEMPDLLVTGSPVLVQIN